ncbi:aldoxime dehydratase [Methylobacillus rhizosphaerae]|uniref:Aldoxime dehydratase n=1 Tax=Methylobacillus rhizosphaerae TaxID=551994 RepID=A0A239A388_9PROT|nr:phenylacetaldoxime dehydratase family protein [Methylobacillus rhizosphaerae]SNR90106.1 aldoxime dehydratase [Methylobacillus rhizosphaerae]
MSTTDHRELESAIPEHLRKPGLCPFRSSAEPPPYPTYVARFSKDINQVVMCYLGIQLRPEGNRKALKAAAISVEELVSLASGPLYVDQAKGVDGDEYETHIFALFWDSVMAYQHWCASDLVQGWWESNQREEDGVGYFKEVFMPKIDFFETHYATPEFQSLGNLADAMSGEIKEHAYWGAMRHRIPAAQYDSLASVGLPSVVSKHDNAKRKLVVPHDYMCLIRSGQNWENADQTEIALYQKVILPSLVQGMGYLSEQGLEIGCYSNRFVTLLCEDGYIARQSYGLSYWSGLDALEKWASSHQTHLKIFAAAQEYMSKLGSEARLTTYHEVAVMAADEQYFEYINCHPSTGLLQLA